jgi:Double zinc ribbon
MRRLEHPRHQTHRTGLRGLGLALVIPGAILTAIGLFSFFGAFGSHSGPPQYFWCVFLGLPMLGLGVNLLRLGYLGSISRYVAGEAAPVVADTVDYVARASAGGLGAAATAIGQGLRGEAGAMVACAACQRPQRADANFCDGCGAAMLQPDRCPGCRAENAIGASFCSQCGTALPTA